MEPFITVVMPVRNEERFIKDTLMQLLHQDYPADRFEIIVADGMSDDGTQKAVSEVSQSYHQVRLMENQKRLSSAGRNIGFKNGRGDVFVVVDGHCYIPDTHLFKNLAKCFEKSGADCLGRPQPLDPPGLTEFQKAVAMARASRIGHSGDSLIYSSFEGYASPVSNGAAYKRGVFQRIGYVDETFDACEDVEFNYRVEKAGLKAYTSPSLTVKYYPRENLKGIFRQMTRYGKGRIRFIRKHPGTFNLDMLIPPVFVAGLILLLVLGLCFLVSRIWPGEPTPLLSYAVYTFAAIYGLYLCIILFESVRIAVRRGLHFLRYIPAIFIVVHFGLGYGFLKEALIGGLRSDGRLQDKG